MPGSAFRLLVVTHEYPPIGGGGSRAIEALSRQLADNGLEVHVLTSAVMAGSPAPDQPAWTRLRIHRLRCFRRSLLNASLYELVLFQILSVPRALRLANALRPDACLAQFGIPGGVTAACLKACTGLPFLVWLGGHDVPGFAGERFPNLVNSGLYRRLLRWTYAKAAVVAPNSTGLEKSLHAVFPSLASTVIPYGVDTERFHPPAARRPAERALTVLSVGRLVERKRHEDLLRAAALVRQKAIAFELVIAGDGPLRRRLEQVARDAGIESCTRFVGFVSTEAVAELYRSADIFVLPSVAEGMPSAVLEAMASGLAVVGTEVQGISDLVRDRINGLLVPPRQPEALASALATILGDQHVRTKLQCAARESAQVHSWTRVAARFEATLSEMMAGGHARRTS